MDALEVPEALAGGGVEGQERVGVEIVAEAVGAVEVGGRRAGGDVDDAAFESTAMPGQLLAAPAVFQASLGQVS